MMAAKNIIPKGFFHPIPDLYYDRRILYHNDHQHLSHWVDVSG